MTDESASNPYDQFGDVAPQAAANPYDSFDRAGGTLGSIERGADKLYGAGEAFVNGMGGGVAAGFTKLNRYLGMSLAGLGSLGDALHSAVTGEQHTENSDFAFRHFVKPSEQVIEHAEGYTHDPLHPTAAGLGGTVGELGSEMAVMLATDGTASPALAKAAVDGAVPVGRLVTEGSSSPVGAALERFGEGLHQSTKFSSLVATEKGNEVGEQVYEETDDPLAAINAGLTQAGLTTVQDAFPVSVDGKLINRIATGAASGTTFAEAAREAMNAATPESMHQDFSWGGLAENALFSAAMGVAFHGPATENPGLLAQRYNGLRAKAEGGDAHATVASELVGDLTAVDGLNGAALDAAEFGAKAGQAAQTAKHEELLAASDRYRQIYQSARPDLDPAAAEAYARTAYSQEVATNSAWTAYTEARKGRSSQLAQAKVASEIKQMLGAAKQTVPAAEMNKLARWAFVKPRGTLAVRDALRQTVEDRKVPDFVEAEQGDNFHPDGALTEDAFRRDNRADLVHVRYPDTPAVAQALRQAGVVPYRLNDGTLAVLGHPESVDAVTGALTELGLAPAGDSHGKADLHAEAQAQEDGQPEGAQGGHPPGERPAAEAGQPAEAERVDQGQAEVGHVSTAERAQPVVDKLVERGVVAPVNREGTITVRPEADETAAQHALDVAAEDTYPEPTPAQAKAGNYRKGGVLFKSAKGDLKVRIETPDGAVRKGPWGSRKIRGAHYGYIPGTKAADGDPVDVLVTRHAHDDSRPVAVINQHAKDGQHDEIKVVLGAKTKAEALETYAKQYPPGMLKGLLPNGKRNIVMMSREKFMRYLRSGETDVPPHPVSGRPMASLRRNRAHVPEEVQGRAGRDRQAREGQGAAPDHQLEHPRVRRGQQDAPEAPPARGLKRVASDAPVYQHGQGAHPVAAVGVHYSGETGLDHLDPRKAGSGKAGRERLRHGRDLGNGDPLTSMVHFYVRTGSRLPPKEPIVTGRHAYEARLNNLYDVKADPDHILRDLDEAGYGRNYDMALEEIHDAGYDGVLMPSLPGMPEGHVASVFGDAPVPVKAAGLAETPRAMFVGPKAKSSFADATEELTYAVNQMFKSASLLGTRLRPGKVRAQMDKVYWAGGDPAVRPAVDRALAALERQGEKVTREQVVAAIKAELPHYAPDAQPPRLHHLDTLDHAKYMERLGEKPAGILKETGWSKGKDGQWRFEINDRAARLTEAGEHDLTQPGVYHLGDVLEHPGLYRAYPDLKSMPVHVDPKLKGAGYHPTEDAIYIHQPKLGVLGPDGQQKLADLSLNMHAREIISQLLHEVQHAVQAREGFEGGATARALDYNTRAGEVEARNVMGRRRLTDEQRRQFTPEYTEDVPRERQTLQPEGLPAAAAQGLQHGGGVRGGQGRLSPAHRAGVRPVEGLPATVRVDGEPVTFGPNPRAVKAAADYAKSAGLPYTRLTDYAKVDEVRAKRIADAYEAMPHAPDDPEVKAAYAAMIRETQAQWEAIKKTGLKVEFIQPGQPDPYASNPRKAILDVNENNHLWVFPTDAGFGSDASFDASANPLLALTGETIGGHALRANDVFRIVHDYFGHIKEGFGFRADGEENAWRSHATMYSPLARRAMTTETRGQNSWVNFGPYAEANSTASGADTHYADQKIGLLPDWAVHEGAPDASDIRAALASAKAEPEPAAPAVRAVESKVSHAAIARHVDGFMEHLKGRAGYEVHRSPADLPADHAVRRWAKAMGAPEDLAGTYYNGRMYLFTDALRDPAEAETVTLHEMVGHGGMRAVFGDDFEDFLHAIVPTIQRTALWHEIEARYIKAMPDIGKAELADEYMAALAEAADRPDTRPVWRQLLSLTRNWLRSHGFRKMRWSEDDLKSLVRATYRGIRDGRISLKGNEPPTVTFDDEHHMSTSTYVGGRGQRGFVDHFADGSRDLRVGGLEATGLRRVARAGGDYLDVTGDLHLTEPKELLALPRFAGEEGLDGVLLDRSALDRALLDASGVPYRDLGDAFALAPSHGPGSPMFSLRNRATGTPAQEAVLKKAIAHSQYNMSFGDRMQQMLRDIRDTIVSGDTALNLKQSYVDALASIGRAERRLNGGQLLDAAESAYKAAWMAKNTEQILAGVMKLGAPVYKDGSFVVQAGRKGLMDIFAPLYKTRDGKSLDMLWEGYAYARRANELIGQTNADGSPREKLLDQAEIDELLALEQTYPQFKQVLDDYQTFNRQLLDLAVDRGALSREMADAWQANTYVPFYRALEDGGTTGPGQGGSGISGKKVTSKRLHGSEIAAQPIIENIIKNAGAILDKVYANEAMRRVVALTHGVGMERVKFPASPVNLSLGEIEKTLQKIGLHVGGKSKATGRYIHFVPQAQMDQLVQFFRMSRPVGHDIVSVMENGKPVYYKVTDPMLLRAVTAFTDIHKFDEVLGAFLGVPKKVLTMGITLDPRFMYRNLLRDTVTAWVQTGSNPNLFNPVKAMEAAKEVWSDGDFINQLRVAGYNGNEYFRVNELREHLEELHGGQRVTVLNTPKKLYRAYHKIGFVSEQLNRMRIAKHVLDQGGSMAEAAWQAQNTLNFQMRGDSRAMQLIIRAVPFLNARIQGLNRLYDGMLGREGMTERRRAVVAFLLKSVGLAVAALALDAWNWNDPRYQRIPEASKDTYYHFFLGDQHFMLPKPFEIGALTGTLPERAARAIAGKDNMRTFVESMKRMAFNTFSFDPREAALWAPLLQDWAGKDAFTGIPIVGLAEQGQLPGAQYDARTSRSAIGVAHAMPAWAPDILRSPDRLEHLYRGYTGSVGAYLMQMADTLLAKTGNAPPEPTSRYGNKVVGALMGTFGLGDAKTDPRTKYLAQFYDAQNMADQAAASLRKYVREGHLEDAREVLQDNRTALAYRNELHAVGKQMKALRQAEIAVYQSTSLTPDQKRERLTAIQQTRVKLLDKLGPMLDLVTDFH